MQADFLLLIAMLLPILGSIPVFIVKKQGFRKAIMVLVLAIQVIVVAGIALTQHGSITFLTIHDWLTFKLTADTLGKLFACLVAAGWLLVAIFAFDYFAKDERAHQFFGFFMITLGTIMGVCYSANLPTLYLFFEMMTFATLPIVVHYRTKKALNAGLKYLAYSIFGAGMALWGMFMLTQNAVSLDFTAGGTLDPVFAAQNRSEIILAYFIMMVGFGAKAGMFPMHSWIPDTYPAAPPPGSAVLSGMVSKMGVLAIIRVTYYIVGYTTVQYSWAQTVLSIMVMITIFMGSMLALKEKTLMRRLAYSSVSQVSYVLFGVFMMSPEAFLGAILQVIYHMLAKNGLFLSTGALMQKKGTDEIEQMRGVGIRLPWVMWTFTLCSLSMIGIPPVCGFVSKWYLEEGALHSGTGALGVVGIVVVMVSALLTACYLLPIVSRSFFPGEHFDRKANLNFSKTSWYMTIPLIILAAAVLAFGIQPVFNGLIESIAEALFV